MEHRQPAVLAFGCEVAIAIWRKFLDDQATGENVYLGCWEEVCHFHDLDDKVPQKILSLGTGFLHFRCVRVVLVNPCLNLCSLVKMWDTGEH